jgi:hypothetical protein
MSKAQPSEKPLPASANPDVNLDIGAGRGWRMAQLDGTAMIPGANGPPLPRNRLTALTSGDSPPRSLHGNRLMRGRPRLHNDPLQ